MCRVIFVSKRRRKENEKRKRRKRVIHQDGRDRSCSAGIQDTLPTVLTGIPDQFFFPPAKEKFARSEERLRLHGASGRKRWPMSVTAKEKGTKAQKKKKGKEGKRKKKRDTQPWQDDDEELRSRKRKFCAPRHTDPFWRAISSRDCALLYIFLSPFVATPWIPCWISWRILNVWLRGEGRRVSSLVHLSLIRWKSGLPAQVFQFVFGRRTIDCSGALRPRCSLEQNSCEFGSTWRNLRKRNLYSVRQIFRYAPARFLTFTTTHKIRRTSEKCSSTNLVFWLLGCWLTRKKRNNSPGFDLLRCNFHR